MPMKKGNPGCPCCDEDTGCDVVPIIVLGCHGAGLAGAFVELLLGSDVVDSGITDSLGVASLQFFEDGTHTIRVTAPSGRGWDTTSLTTTRSLTCPETNVCHCDGVPSTLHLDGRYPDAFFGIGDTGTPLSVDLVYGGRPGAIPATIIDYGATCYAPVTRTMPANAWFSGPIPAQAFEDDPGIVYYLWGSSYACVFSIQAIVTNATTGTGHLAWSDYIAGQRTLFIALNPDTCDGFAGGVAVFERDCHVNFGTGVTLTGSGGLIALNFNGEKGRL